MDLLEGCTLRKCIRDKKEFNEKQIRFIASGIVLGLEALHALSIIHRDIKPGNIMIDN